MTARCSIGIDLGTSNSAVAWAGDQQRVTPFEMEQFFGPGDVRRHPLLPSVLYYPAEHEADSVSLGLPWDPECPYVVGHLARQLGSRIPARLIHSAKSWLCHGAVDRRSPILPWSADEDVTRLSPVEASASYLLYMREAWDRDHPDDPMDRQEVILAVPASFDAVARELTLEAARMAELPEVILLEEPQAAFYAWIDTQGEQLSSALGDVKTLLVCDVGGGTTDFTLVVVTRKAGEVRLVRVAVGDHLLLGGDNMDLGLGHQMEMKLTGGPGRLEPDEWGELVHGCRVAKEELLGSGERDSAQLSILGRGSGLVGGTRTTELTREELQRVVLEGFFPACSRGDSPMGDDSLGLKEFGLPYAADAGITRHLAAFLRDASSAVEAELGTGSGASVQGLVKPDGILFNGGVFEARALRVRLVECMKGWFPRDDSYEPRVLFNELPGEAVARGAAYYASARRGEGVRIGGGSARSYYVGLGAAGDEDGTGDSLCVVPRGLEEGEILEIEQRRFRLAVGRAASFPLLASATRPDDQAGDLVPARDRGLVALPPLETAFEEGKEAGEVEVQLRSSLAATGVLELSCHPIDGPGLWKLEFDLKPPGGFFGVPSAAGAIVSLDCLEAARDVLRCVFGKSKGHSKSPRGLRKRLDQAMGAPRESWDTGLLRQLWQTVEELQAGRKLSAGHEAQWMQLAGWCLRPGFGDPLDEGRIKRLEGLMSSKPRFGRVEANHRAFWVMWRRVAAGLDTGRQVALYGRISASLLLGDRKSREMQGVAESPGVVAEMWRLAAALERLDPQCKIELGERMLGLLSSDRPPDHGFWVMARLAARQPVTGAIHQLVDRRVVQRWIPGLVRLVRSRGERASFAVAHAARKTGDRYRDISEGQRAEVLSRLTRLGLPDRHLQMIREVIHLGDSEQASLLGDSVPPGLRLSD